MIETGLSSGTPCGAPAGSRCREVPDVSADADPNTGYLIYWTSDAPATQTGWWQAGGTSAAAPLWAGLDRARGRQRLGGCARGRSASSTRASTRSPPGGSAASALPT